MQIGSSNDTNAVKAQYATSKGLDTRISFHDKYSTNKQGFGNWIVSNYDIREGMTVLELGCGTGSDWFGHEDLIDKCGKLVMTDFSEGMLGTAEENLGKRDNVEYRQADIQDLPFDDGSFDLVIANMMMYHVPDQEKAIREVRRVLKKGGRFYCATFGEHNFNDTLFGWLSDEGEPCHANHNFTLQNGKEKLAAAFTDVQVLRYEDSLRVTDIEDLVGYLMSLASFKAIMSAPADKIRSILEQHAVDGVIDLDKEYGMFVAE